MTNNPLKHNLPLQEHKWEKRRRENYLISRWNLPWLQYCVMLLEKCIMGYYSILLCILRNWPKLSYNNKKLSIQSWHCFSLLILETLISNSRFEWFRKSNLDRALSSTFFQSLILKKLYKSDLRFDMTRYTYKGSATVYCTFCCPCKDSESLQLSACFKRMKKEY